MELVHLKSLKKLNNDDDITDIENEFIDNMADDGLTFVRSVRETKSSLPIFNGDDALDFSFGDVLDDPKEKSNTGPNDVRGSTTRDLFVVPDFNAEKDPLADVKFDKDYSENNAQIKKIMNRLNVHDTDNVIAFEEDKINMIEDINRDRQMLEDAGEKFDDIPEVDESMDYEYIQRIYKKTKRRKDNMLYAESSGAIIMTACKALENVFNGRRSLFGYRPNLSGWTDRFVRGKLKLFKTIGSRMMSEKLKTYGLSESSELLIQLVPGAIMYASTKKSTDGLREDDYSNAREVLNPDTE